MNVLLHFSFRVSQTVVRYSEILCVPIYSICQVLEFFPPVTVTKCKKNKQTNKKNPKGFYYI